ncbi:DNA/RNA helicase [Lichenibacterium minor]|uniref:DNA/RNA helicase n=1 Tax=Lichenibacterium minor TaxID=2316528 RepID=A0A4Q2U2B9_9HYPH|nr:helicase-related protein [Lichenibacterium minor]RYC30290.1 DNA/RNA helicase [Lichenibacterium minor]
MVETVSLTGTARELVVQRLTEDLIGPREPEEKLKARPSDVWLTGILWPSNTELAPEEDERLAVAGDGESTGEDTDDQARPAAVTMRRPSTAGLSFAVRAEDGAEPEVEVRISFALYQRDESDPKDRHWRRVPKTPKAVRATLEAGFKYLSLDDVPELPGLALNVRAANYSGGRLATITLVNACQMEEPDRNRAEMLTMFQVTMELVPGGKTIFIARPSRRAVVDDDDASAALLYRHAREYAAGHTCSADWTLRGAGDDCVVEALRISWLPAQETPAVSSAGHPVFQDIGRNGVKPLSASWLASAPAVALLGALGELCDAYQKWIEIQTAAATRLDAEHRKAAHNHLRQAGNVLVRMKKGATRLATDPDAALSFRLANLAMHTQSTWKGNALQWRPFQLGFLLLSLESAIDGEHPDRNVMDLLWFPTGGGKTEAYLGLIALVAFHRRVSRKNPDDGAGVAAIMRYTLRLLTTQQFIRASAMIAACEAIRRGKVATPQPVKLGTVPFSIGLWVGGDATPNDRRLAFASKTDPMLSRPDQLTDCPCCHKRLQYAQEAAADPVTVKCSNQSCLLFGAQLPVWTVDEDIYIERPTLIIGTVDKFAQIVRSPSTAQLFGVGTRAQPQLILQDELHLIAGPLGTLAGLYESAIDIILSTDGTQPKIIGSTATIRRASEQVKALFSREICQFPPPGLNSSDSGFAVIDQDQPGRLYVGVTTSGRSAKFTLQAVAASLLQTAAALPDKERDPYWTLVTYFNSLRELGGALVLFQDDVHDTLDQVSRARGETIREPEVIEELTSRRSQNEIKELLKELDYDAASGMALDAVLATNMLSVGVDIPRLGLMLVNGQPKTMAEYIQSTSRVGRGKVAGLVVPVLNAAKPRDRSHFETFRTWHATLYRDVEATSVTPFASRARDRALHAVLVAIIRHRIPGMLAAPAIDDAVRIQAEALIELVAQRARDIDPLETEVKKDLLDRLNRWIRLAPEFYWKTHSKGSLLQGAEEAAAKRAAGRSPGQAWPTPNSMRNVEPVTPYRLTEGLKGVQNAR